MYKNIYYTYGMTFNDGHHGRDAIQYDGLLQMLMHNTHRHRNT